MDTALAGQPQQVTRRGKPAVVVLSMADYDRMRQAADERRGRFLQHLLEFPGLDDEARPLARPRHVNF